MALRWKTCKEVLDFGKAFLCCPVSEDGAGWRKAGCGAAAEEEEALKLFGHEGHEDDGEDE